MVDSNEVKSGVKTSEFWTTVVGTLSMAAPAICAAVSGWGAAATVLGAAASVLPAVYVWGRSILKAEQARATSVIPDAWEPLLEGLFDLTEAISNSSADAAEQSDDH